MDHGYPAEQWVEFLEGTLAMSAASTMKEHIAGCSQCQATYEDLRLSRRQLAQLSERIDVQAGETEASAARIRQAVLARIRIAQAASAGRAIAVGVEELRRVLQPICGQATTESAIRSAAQRCRAASAEEISHAEWGPFVGQLGSIMDAICGASVAHWIFAIARSVEWETDLSC